MLNVMLGLAGVSTVLALWTIYYTRRATARAAQIRRQSEASLRRSQEQFRVLVQGVKDYAIYMLDPQGRVASWNSGAQEIKGYLQAEILGEHFSCFYTAHDRENGKPQAALATAERTGRFEDDGWRLRKDGSRFWANVVVVPIRDVDGTLLGFAKVTRDNTERHHLAQLKTDFVSTLSHELRTPLTSIRGSLGLVVGSATGELPPTARRFLEIAYTNSSRLIQLVDEILDVEGIESGHVSFHREHITARDIVDQAIESNQAYAELFGVTFRVTTTPGDDGDVFGDMLRIQQVMSNLLSNAAKFSPAGSSVEVAATAERDAIRFAVRDHGAGIPIAFRHRIFQRFAQADSSDQRQKGGTGLGLSISKAIVELHGGSIGYDNLSDGGTEFWFTLARLSTAQKPTHERLSVGVR